MFLADDSVCFNAGDTFLRIINVDSVCVGEMPNGDDWRMRSSLIAHDQTSPPFKHFQQIT